ncbi:hypothetical protein ES707_13401 [subsurface metagenome]
MSTRREALRSALNRVGRAEYDVFDLIHQTASVDALKPETALLLRAKNFLHAARGVLEKFEKALG